MKNNEILKKRLSLYNGVKIPQFGMGTYDLTDEKITYQAIITALEHGYRNIDTAEIYGNEKVIGRAIKDFLAANPSVKRSDLFITSKIWNSNHSYERAKKAFESILKRLQLDYLDLCLVHWPTKDRFECWKALEDIYASGKVKAIGVSNFTIEQLSELISKANIKPMLNQFESHPGFGQVDVLNFCKENDIVVTGWKTLIGGEIANLPLLTKLAKKYNTTNYHIALRWACQMGEAVIPKSANKERIISNTQIDNFELSEADMTEINSMKQSRFGWDPNNEDTWWKMEAPEFE